MQHARRSRPQPPAEPDLRGYIEGAERTRVRIEQYLDQIGVLASRPYAPGAFSGLNAGLRQAGAEMSGYVAELSRINVEQTLNEMEAAVEHGAGFRAGAMASGGRHRANRNRRPGKGQLMLISGGVAASLVAGTAATGGFSDLANFSPTPAAHHGASSLPDLSPVVAAPITVSPVQQGYVPRHARPTADASTASQVPASAPVIVAAPPSSQAPSPTPSAAPSGTVDIATMNVTISGDGTGTITFTAQGDASWSAQPSDPALSLDVSGGMLADGQPQVITVTVARGSLAGSGYITFTAGGQQENIPVRWESVPG